MTSSRLRYVALFALLACAPDDIGIAVQTPEINVTPNPLEFGPSAVPLVHILPVLVSNAGHADLDVTLQIDGADAALFAIAESTLTLKPGEDHPVDLSFTPATFLDYSATLVLTRQRRVR